MILKNNSNWPKPRELKKLKSEDVEMSFSDHQNLVKSG